jgi:hypothetical protein
VSRSTSHPGDIKTALEQLAAMLGLATADPHAIAHALRERSASATDSQTANELRRLARRLRVYAGCQVDIIARTAAVLRDGPDPVRSTHRSAPCFPRGTAAPSSRSAGDGSGTLSRSEP